MGIHTLKTDIIAAIADPNFLTDPVEDIINSFQGSASSKLTSVAVERVKVEETLTEAESARLDEIIEECGYKPKEV